MRRTLELLVARNNSIMISRARGGINEREAALLRVLPGRQDFPCRDGRRPTATNSSLHRQPRIGIRRITQVFQQYGYIPVKGSTIEIRCIPARAMLWRKHRQLLQILCEQVLFRRGRKLSQYEPLERIPEHLSTLNLMSENQPSFLGGGLACWQEK